MEKYLWSLIATVFQKYFSRSGTLQVVTNIVKVVLSKKRYKIDMPLLKKDKGSPYSITEHRVPELT